MIQSHQLKSGSDIIVKLIGKNRFEFSLFAKVAEREQASKTDILKDVSAQSMRDATEKVEFMPDLSFRAGMLELSV